MNYTVQGLEMMPWGGIMPIPPQAEGTPPNWGGYVTVDDVDAPPERRRSWEQKYWYHSRIFRMLAGFLSCRILRGR